MADASLMISWLLPDEVATGPTIVEAEQEGAVAPGLWLFEAANALVVANRRGRLDDSLLDRALLLLMELPVMSDSSMPSDVTSGSVAIARAHGLSVYDAVYLELARRKGLPLATVDARLRDAAVLAGLALR